MASFSPQPVRGPGSHEFQHRYLSLPTLSCDPGVCSLAGRFRRRSAMSAFAHTECLCCQTVASRFVRRRVFRTQAYGDRLAAAFLVLSPAVTQSTIRIGSAVTVVRRNPLRRGCLKHSRPEGRRSITCTHKREHYVEHQDGFTVNNRRGSTVRDRA